MRKLKDVVSLFFMTLCFDLGIVAKKIPGAQLVSQRLPACFIPTAAPVHTCDPEIYDWHPVTYSSVRLRPSSLSKPLEALVDIKMWWVRRQCNNSRPRFSQLHQTCHHSINWLPENSTSVHWCMVLRTSASKAALVSFSKVTLEDSQPNSFANT